MEVFFSFIDKYFGGIGMVKIDVIDCLEMLIIAFIIYKILIWTQNTKAWNLFKGILVIMVSVFIAYTLQMTTILWIVRNASFVAIGALIVVFQPELRRALDSIGRQNMFLSFIPTSMNTSDEKNGVFDEKTVNEITKACFDMGKVKTGALIVIERINPMNDIERTGIVLDALVSSQLIINIFEHNTPLHDGAIVIRGNRISTATDYLPLSDNMALSKELGTRHRAALGITEVNDSIAVIVSEETGHVSVAKDGILKRNCTEAELRERLMEACVAVEEPKRFKGFKAWGRSKKYAKKRNKQ